jgi:hypothetical protein
MEEVYRWVVIVREDIVFQDEPMSMCSRGISRLFVEIACLDDGVLMSTSAREIRLSSGVGRRNRYVCQ